MDPNESKALRDDASSLERMIGPSAERVADAIRTGICPTDRAFDRFLPGELKTLSSQHWTPIVVASVAADWLHELGTRTVVDIGSGAGKFCVVAALAGLCRFTGIEHRKVLVEAARDLARLFGVDDRVTFVEGALGEVATPEADVYYLFNPFGENLFSEPEHIDDTVSLDRERFDRDVAIVEELLMQAPLGTHLLTYNGFGGMVPGSYREVRIELNLPCPLRLWKKTRSGNAGRPISSGTL